MRIQKLSGHGHLCDSTAFLLQFISRKFVGSKSVVFGGGLNSPLGGALSLPNPLVLPADLIAHHYTSIDKLLPGSFHTTAKISMVGHAQPDFFHGGRLPTLPPCQRP